MSTPEIFDRSYVSSSHIATQLAQLGVMPVEQGVVVNGARCFVYEWRPEHTSFLLAFLPRPDRQIEVPNDET